METLKGLGAMELVFQVVFGMAKLQPASQSVDRSGHLKLLLPASGRGKLASKHEIMFIKFARLAHFLCTPHGLHMERSS